MRAINRKAVLCAAISSALFASRSVRANSVWSGSTNNLWTTNTNWFFAVPPGTGDVAFFDGGNPGLIRSLVILDQDKTIAGIEVNNESVVGLWRLQSQNNAKLTVTGVTHVVKAITAPTPNFDGLRLDTGTLKVESVGAQLRIQNGSQVNSSGDIGLFDNVILNLESASQVTAARVVMNDSSDVNVGSSTLTAKIELSFSTNILTISSGGQVNAGSLETGFGGKVEVNSGGTLSLTGNGTVSNGLVHIASGATLKMNSGVSLTSGGASTIQFDSLHQLSHGASLRATGGGDIVGNSYVDIGAGGAGTLLIDGVGSNGTFGSGTNPFTDWSSGALGVANVTISTSGIADYNRGLAIAANGGNATVNLNTNGQVNADLFLLAGGTGAATININAGNLTSTGTALFGNSAKVTLQSTGVMTLNDATFASGSTLTSDGVIFLNGNTTFATGSTFNYNSGALVIPSGRTLTVGGTVNLASPANKSLPDGVTLKVTTGGNFSSASFYDIANGSGTLTGTLIVDGAAAAFQANSSFSDWGKNTNNAATVTFSNGAVGTFLGSGIAMSSNGGASTLSLLSTGIVVTNGLSAGSAIGGGATININGGGLNVTGNLTLNNGALINYSSGGLRVDGALTMSGNSRINCSSGASKILRMESLSMFDTSAIDMDFNEILFVRNTGLGVSPLTTMRGLISIGYNNGTWFGNRVTSSAAGNYNPFNTGKVGLAYRDDGNAIDVVLLRAGDANFDEQVNALDFNALASHFAQTNRFWSEGDFDYNGTVNMLDFNLLAGNFNQPSVFDAPLPSALSLGSLVPEPASLAALAVLAVLRRRRAK